jgi:hypothetical protein
MGRSPGRMHANPDSTVSFVLSDTEPCQPPHLANYTAKRGPEGNSNLGSSG